MRAHLSTAAAALSVAALGLVSLNMAQAATAAPAATPGAAHVWITTPDGSLKMSDQGTVPFTSDVPTVPTVVVDPSRTFQTMTGFGASITDSSASVLYGLSAAARAATMRDLFDPVNGDGLSMLRQPIGASDFVATQDYTYDDLPAGATDYRQSKFSIAHDEAQILPLLREAKRLNPQLTVMATPWSPPAWMKTSGSLVGGKLIDDPKIYNSYALYLLRFIEAYRAAGVPVDLISVQNEPQNRTPSGYPGTDLSAAQEAKVIEKLGSLLRGAHLHTKILAYDHNWMEHPNDAAVTPPDEVSEINRYPQAVLDSPARHWISGVAFHCYYGDPSAMTALHKLYPTEDIYFTECSGSVSGVPANTFSDTLKWHTRNLVIGATRNWAKSVVNWNLALDPTGGPHVGGCGTCTAVVTVAPDGNVTRNAEYYTLGHLSRFVKPGAVRIASTSFGTVGWNGQVMDVTFRNPDGSTVMVAHNENDNPQSFAVSENGKAFTYNLPGGALATFVWGGAGTNTSHLRQLDPSDWKITGMPTGPDNPCCAGDVLANAIDDDASTRYSSGASQAPGQYITVDLGSREEVTKFVVDTGASTGDFPRGYAVQTSTNGRDWKPAVTGVGSGEFATVSLSGARIRYIRFTLTEANGSWWSVADVRAYVAGR